MATLFLYFDNYYNHLNNKYLYYQINSGFFLSDEFYLYYPKHCQNWKLIILINCFQYGSL